MQDKMGLCSGERGVKRELLRQHANACHRAPWATTAYRDFGFEQETTVTVRDANVMVMQLCYSSDIKSLDEYVECVKCMCIKMLHSARAVVMCVDEPESVPKKKSVTQQKRDAGQKVLQLPIQDDNYNLNDLLEVQSCGELIRNRNTRYRFIDELFRRVLAIIEAEMAVQRDDVDDGEAASSLLENGVFIVDGIDPRGANRSIGVPREPTVQGTDLVLVKQIIERRILPLGEADVKTADIDKHFRQHLQEWPVTAIIHDTVDTDAIPIVLLNTSSLVTTKSESEESLPAPRSYIMFRERGSTALHELAKAGKELKRKHYVMQEQTGRQNSGVLVMDTHILHHALLKYMLGPQWNYKYTCHEWHKCVRLMVTAWIMSGCDYCQHLAHGDLLMQAVRAIAKHSLDQIPDHFLFDKEWNALLRRVLMASGEYDKRITLKKRDKLSSVQDADIENVPWILGYWELLR